MEESSKTSDRKVYLLTTGEHSDYRIIGAYSSEEAAKDIVGGIEVGPYDTYRVEAYTLDESTRPGKDVFLYDVWMELYSGDNASAGRAYMVSSRLAKPFVSRRLGPPKICVNCWARDEKHAIKIANEKRIAYKLENLK